MDSQGTVPLCKDANTFNANVALVKEKLLSRTLQPECATDHSTPGVAAYCQMESEALNLTTVEIGFRH